MIIHAILHEASTLLSQTIGLSNKEAKLEIQLLLQTVISVNRAWLILHENDVLQPDDHKAFVAMLNRRLRGEPIAYILGNRDFFNLNLMVTPDTLIPRPDSETLVEAVFTKISKNSDESILDLGTGTGAIALAVAKNRPLTTITAVDASIAALEIAMKNGLNLKINNIEFILSNWFDNLNNRTFDLIVSNPPYIEENDVHLTQGDLRFEPISALSSGADGLDDIRKIINDCLIHLKPQGWIMIEHGYNQAEKVANLMAGTGLINIETIKDLGNNDRVTIGRNSLIVSTHWQ